MVNLWLLRLVSNVSHFKLCVLTMALRVISVERLYLGSPHDCLEVLILILTYTHVHVRHPGLGMSLGGQRSRWRGSTASECLSMPHSVIELHRHSLDGATVCCWPHTVILVRLWCCLPNIAVDWCRGCGDLWVHVWDFETTGTSIIIQLSLHNLLLLL